MMCFHTIAQEIEWLEKSTSNDMFTTHRFYSDTNDGTHFYFAGDFWKDIIFDGLSIQIEDDLADSFILKLDNKGNASSLWHFASQEYVRINSINYNNSSSSLIITGYYRQDMTYNGTRYTGQDFTGFIMSLTPEGEVEWMNEFLPVGSSYAVGSMLISDEFGNNYAGISAGGIVDINGVEFDMGQDAGGIILLKYDQNGNLLKTNSWTNLEPFNNINIGNIDIDNNGDLVFGGSFSGTLQTSDTIISVNDTQPMLVKMDQDLNTVWLKVYQAIRGSVEDFYVDGSDIIASFNYNTSLEIDGNFYEGTGTWAETVIARLDGSGKLKWAKNFTLTENSGNSSIVANEITKWLDHYYIAGMYQADAEYEDQLILNNNDSGSTYQYAYLLSLDEDGELLEVHDFVGSRNPSRITNISSIDSHLVFAGNFSGTIAIEGNILNTVNSTLFHGGLKDPETSFYEIEKVAAVQLYPNPSSERINIYSESIYNKIELLNSEGRVLNQWHAETRSIPVNELPSGSYFLKLYFGSEFSTFKFIR